MAAKTPLKALFDGDGNPTSLAEYTADDWIRFNDGGTGYITYTDGQILIGKTSDGSLNRTTLTGTSNQINVINSSGEITLQLPQNIHSAATPTFAGLTVNGNGQFTGTLGVDGRTCIDDTLEITGNLIVAGTTTTTNSDTLVVSDKNITLAHLAKVLTYTSISYGTGYSEGTNISTSVSPAGGTGLTVDITDVDGVGAINTFSINQGGTGYDVDDVVTIDGGTTDATFEVDTVGNTDANADGGGIILQGATDKTILWTDSTDSWGFNQHLHVTGNLKASTCVCSPTICGGNVNINANTISTTNTNGNLTITPNGTGCVNITKSTFVNNINLNTNTISTTDTNGDLIITPDGIGCVDITKSTSITDTPFVGDATGSGTTITLLTGNTTGLSASQVVYYGAYGSVTIDSITDSTHFELTASPGAITFGSIHTHQNSLLDINASSLGAAVDISQSSIGKGLKLTHTGATGDLVSIIDGSTERFTILQGGNVGINQATPACALDVTGTFRATGNSSIGGTFGVTGATALNGGLTMDTDKFIVADDTGNTTIGGTLGVTGNTTIGGNLTVNGITTTVNSTTLTIDDKNIELAHSPSESEGDDTAVDGGGITLKSSDSDKCISWRTATNSWDFNQKLYVSQAGTAKSDIVLLDLTNIISAADMDDTTSSIQFNQYYYDATTPAKVDSAKITVGTECDWTSTAATQDSYMSFSTGLNGAVAEKVRIKSDGNVGINDTNPSHELSITGSACISSCLCARDSTWLGDTANTDIHTIVGKTSIDASTSDYGLKLTQAGSGIGFELTGTGAGDLVNIKDGTTEVFTILDGGNVGINDTNPSHELSITGSACISSCLCAKDSTWLGDTVNTDTHTIKGATTITSTAATGVDIQSTSTTAGLNVNQLKTTPSAGKGLVLTQEGDNTAFEINQNGIGAGLVLTHSGASGGVLTRGSLNDVGSGYSDGTGVATTVSPASGTGLTVDVTTNVGQCVIGVVINDVGSGYNVGDVITITGGNTDATFDVASITEDIVNIFDSSTEVFTIIQGGSATTGLVGINDTAPSHTLTVGGSGCFSCHLIVKGNTYLGDVSNLDTHTIKGATSIDAGLVGATVATGLDIDSYSTTASLNVIQRCDGKGLVLNQKGDNTAFDITQCGEGIGLRLIHCSDGDLVNIIDRISSTNTEVFTILQGGNVGIKQATPAYTLDVTGTANITSHLCARGNVWLGDTYDDCVIVAGDLFVNGTCTTINASVMEVEDIHIEIGSVDQIATFTATGLNSGCDDGTYTNVATVTTETHEGAGGSGATFNFDISAGNGILQNLAIGNSRGCGYEVDEIIKIGDATIKVTAVNNLDTAADGGGIVLQGESVNKTITWNNTNNSWNLNQALYVCQAEAVVGDSVLLDLTNCYSNVDMDGTTTSILFNQYYYDEVTPAKVDSAKITVGTESDWTSTAATQDSYMSFSTVDDGTLDEAVRIISNGNVGIGTIAPANKLSITDGVDPYTTANVLLQVKRNASNSDDDTSRSAIMLANTSNVFTIAYGGTTDRLRFLDGGDVERLTILNGGNVGINDINPSHELSVTGSACISNNTCLGDTNSTDTHEIRGKTWIDANAADYGLKLCQKGSGIGFELTGAGTGDLVNIKDGTTEVFTILDGGNIGICEADPVYPLHISEETTNIMTALDWCANDTAGATLALRKDRGGTRAIQLGDVIGEVGFYSNPVSDLTRPTLQTAGILVCATCTYNNDSGYSHPSEMIFKTTQIGNGYTLEERMRLTHAGRLGIGTNDPNTFLHVHEDSSANAYLLVTNDSTDQARYGAVQSLGGVVDAADVYTDAIIGQSLATVNATGSMAGSDLKVIITEIQDGKPSKLSIDPANAGSDYSDGDYVKIVQTADTICDSCVQVKRIGADGFLIGIDGRQNAKVWNNEDRAIIFGASGCDRFRVSRTGAIGVGVVNSGIPSSLFVNSAAAAMSGYTTGTNCSVAGGNGSNMTVDITAAGGDITCAVINQPGSGYCMSDLVTVSGGTGGTLRIDEIDDPDASLHVMGQFRGLFRDSNNDIVKSFSDTTDRRLICIGDVTGFDHGLEIGDALQLPTLTSTWSDTETFTVLAVVNNCVCVDKNPTFALTSGGNGQEGFKDDNIFKVQTGNNRELITVDSSGNLGVNVANPEYKLDVCGKARFRGALSTLIGGSSHYLNNDEPDTKREFVFTNSTHQHGLLFGDAVSLPTGYIEGCLALSVTSNNWKAGCVITGATGEGKSGGATAVVTVVYSQNLLGFNTGVDGSTSFFTNETITGDNSRTGTISAVTIDNRQYETRTVCYLGSGTHSGNLSPTGSLCKFVVSVDPTNTIASADSLLGYRDDNSLIDIQSGDGRPRFCLSKSGRLVVDGEPEIGHTGVGQGTLMIGQDNRLYNTQVNAVNIVKGSTYKILSSGDTTWSSLGSSSNDVGTVFEATSAGIDPDSGTGTALFGDYVKNLMFDCSQIQARSGISTSPLTLQLLGKPGVSVGDTRTTHQNEVTGDIINNKLLVKGNARVEGDLSVTSDFQVQGEQTVFTTQYIDTIDTVRAVFLSYDQPIFEEAWPWGCGADNGGSVSMTGMSVVSGSTWEVCVSTSDKPNPFYSVGECVTLSAVGGISYSGDTIVGQESPSFTITEVNDANSCFCVVDSNLGGIYSSGSGVGYITSATITGGKSDLDFDGASPKNIGDGLGNIGLPMAGVGTSVPLGGIGKFFNCSNNTNNRYTINSSTFSGVSVGSIVRLSKSQSSDPNHSYCAVTAVTSTYFDISGTVANTNQQEVYLQTAGVGWTSNVEVPAETGIHSKVATTSYSGGERGGGQGLALDVTTDANGTVISAAISSSKQSGVIVASINSGGESYAVGDRVSVDGSDDAGKVISISVAAGGASYALGDTFTIAQDSGGTDLATGEVTAVNSGAATVVSLTYAGSGYDYSDTTLNSATKATIKTSGGGNNALTVNVTIGNAIIEVTSVNTGIATGIKVIAEGSSYEKTFNANTVLEAGANSNGLTVNISTSARGTGYSNGEIVKVVDPAGTGTDVYFAIDDILLEREWNVTGTNIDLDTVAGPAGVNAVELTKDTRIESKGMDLQYYYPYMAGDVLGSTDSTSQTRIFLKALVRYYSQEATENIKVQFYDGTNWNDIFSGENRLSDDLRGWHKLTADLTPFISKTKGKVTKIALVNYNDAGVIQAIHGGTGNSNATGVGTGTSPSGGSGLTVDTVVTSGSVTGVTINAVGANYEEDDIVQIGSTGAYIKILQVDTDNKIRFEINAGHANDYLQVADVIVYESDVPTQLGDVFLGKQKTGIGTNKPNGTLTLGNKYDKSVSMDFRANDSTVVSTNYQDFSTARIHAEALDETSTGKKLHLQLPTGENTWKSNLVLYNGCVGIGKCFTETDCQPAPNGSSTGDGLHVLGNIRQKNNSLLQSTTVLDNRHEQTLFFDGTTDYVSIADNDAIDFGTDDFSLEAWIKTSATCTQYILQKSSSTVGYGLILRPSGVLRSSINTIDTTTNETISDGKWHHVVATFTRNSATGAQIYIDGIEATYSTQGDISSLSDTTINNSENLVIGKSSYLTQSYSNYFAGEISTIRLFGYDLSHDDIISLYNGKPVDYGEKGSFTVNDQIPDGNFSQSSGTNSFTKWQVDNRDSDSIDWDWNSITTGIDFPTGYTSKAYGSPGNGEHGTHWQSVIRTHPNNSLSYSAGQKMQASFWAKSGQNQSFGDNDARPVRVRLANDSNDEVSQEIVGGGDIVIDTVWRKYHIIFVTALPSSGGGKNLEFQVGNSDTPVHLTGVEFTRVGLAAEYLPEGISSTSTSTDSSQWYDSSGNDLNGTIYSGVSGANLMDKGKFLSPNYGFKTCNSGENSSVFGFESCATNQYGTAVGYCSCAITNAAASAFGYKSIASGQSSSAIGYNASASDTGATAVGYNTSASAASASAFGRTAIASGVDSTAVGYNSYAAGVYSSSFGTEVCASSDYSTAVGQFTWACAEGSSAFGYKARTCGDCSVVLGQCITSDSDKSVAVGICGGVFAYQTLTPANVVGDNTSGWEIGDVLTGVTTGAKGIVQIWYSHAVVVRPYTFTKFADTEQVSHPTVATKTLTDAYQFNVSSATSIGVNSCAHNNYTTVVGFANLATGDCSTSMGHCNWAKGTESTSMGYQSCSSGGNAVAVGHCAQADGNSSTAIGGSQGNTSVDAGSFLCGKSYKINVVGTTDFTAIGASANTVGVSFTATDVGTGTGTALKSGPSTADGTSRAIAIGSQAYSAGDDSIAIGSDTIAGTYCPQDRKYNCSIAIGFESCAPNCYSTSVGYKTIATGCESTAVGKESLAAGFQSTSVGMVSVASGSNTSAFGSNAQAIGNCTTALGYCATSRIACTANIGGALITKKDSGTSAETAATAFYQYASAEITLMTKNIDLTSTGTHTITIPTGSTFYISEMGVITTGTFTKGSGSILPTISIGNQDSLSNQFDTRTMGTNIDASGVREKYLPGDPDVGNTALKITISTGSNYTTISGRFYFKGMLIEDQ